MKKISWLLAFSLFALPVTGNASSGMMMSRGGLGFLFQDHNAFNNLNLYGNTIINAGQLALDNGTGLSVDYTTQSNGPGSGTSQQTATPSLVYGNGHFGFGVAGTRSGTSMTDAAQKSDSLAAAMGIALANDRLTIGILGSKNIDVNQTNAGVVGGTITWNGPKRIGFSAGVGVDTELSDVTGTNLETGVAAIGWGFSEMTKFEVVGTFNNLTDFSDYNIGGFLTLEGKMLYFSGGVNYQKLSAATEAVGRLGLDFGKVDVAVFVGNSFVTSTQPEFGGSLRIVF